MYVEYSSNNSGGHWWLADKDWKALEKAGWVVAWASMEHVAAKGGDCQRDKRGMPKLKKLPATQKTARFVDKGKDGAWRYMGALAHEAYLPDCGSLEDAAASWEKATGQSALSAGCACCGKPHNFTLYDEKGTWMESGPEEHHSCEW